MDLRKATIYNLVSKYGAMLMQLVLTMVLARIILPEEYGVVAILTVILNFLSLLSDMGLGISIIQHPKMGIIEQRQLFSFSLFLGCGIVAIMIIVAYPVSIIYHNSSYCFLCPLISISGFFNALNIVPNAILIRDKRFDIIAIRSILATLIPGIVAIIAAIHNAGVFALLLQSISGSVFLFMWNYVSHPLIPCRFKFKKVFQLMGRYSLFQFLFNIINYFTRNLDNFIIGAKFGDKQLGYYNKAYTLNLYPNTLFTSVFTGVLHPYIRDYNNNFDLLEKKIVDILKVLSLIGILVMLICFGCSEEIIIIMFGKMWEPAIPCFKMLSICIWAQMLSSVAGSVFLGIERTDRVFICGIINIVLIVIAIVLGLVNGTIAGVSLMIGIAYNFIFHITYYVLISTTFKSNYWIFLRHFLNDIVFASICLIVISIAPFPRLGVFSSLIIKTVIYTAVYAVYLFVTKQYVHLMKLFKKMRTNA